VSVVDRFLEHSRIYYFFNGGDKNVYLASGDWMTRSLDKRVELRVPIERAEHKGKVLHALRATFRDTTKGRWLGKGDVYRKREPRPATRRSASRKQHWTTRVVRHLCRTTRSELR
jgi:polyphosphate kinase